MVVEPVAVVSTVERSATFCDSVLNSGAACRFSAVSVVVSLTSPLFDWLTEMLPNGIVDPCEHRPDPLRHPLGVRPGVGDLVRRQCLAARQSAGHRLREQVVDRGQVVAQAGEILFRVPSGGARGFLDGKLALGTWQGIYLWEHRDRPTPREILVSLY